MKIKRQALAEEIGEDVEAGSGGGAVNERESYLAIVNPAAGGGRSRKMLGPALERLRAGGRGG